jgi:sigma-54-specific transcriptional regulator
MEADDLRMGGRVPGARIAAPSYDAAPIAAAVAASPLERLEALLGELLEAGDAALFDTVEERLIRTAFAACEHNQVQTAKVLGLSRNVLRTHLKRFGLIGAEPAPGRGDIHSFHGMSVAL